MTDFITFTVNSLKLLCNSANASDIGQMSTRVGDASTSVWLPFCLGTGIGIVMGKVVGLIFGAEENNKLLFSSAQELQFIQNVGRQVLNAVAFTSVVCRFHSR